METVNYLFEEWRDIEGYLGLYQVSNFGRVKSLSRIVCEKTGKQKHIKERILKPGYIRGGYLGVALHNGCGQKTFKIHRLVAKAFIPNPDNLPFINHKDENPQNNCVWNLEWCTHTYNINYGSCKTKMAERKAKPVVQYDLNMNFIAEYPSIKEAEKALGIRHICDVCLGRYKQSSGYIWRYKEQAC